MNKWEEYNDVDSYFDKFFVCLFVFRRLSDVLKRKKPSKRGPAKKGSKAEESNDLGIKSPSLCGSRSSSRGKASASKLLNCIQHLTNQEK